MAGFYTIFNHFSLIKEIPIFEKLNWFDIQRIASKAKVIEFKKGDIIYNQGDPPDAFYCLVSGRLKAYTTDQDSNKCNVEFIRRGMHFGVISTLTGENHSLSFQALNDSVVIKVDRNDFQEILRSIPDLGADLSRGLSRRIRSRALHPKSIFESTIISVYGPVKESGSSTYAANLAYSLKQETQKEVVLVHFSSSNTSTDQSKSSDQYSGFKFSAQKGASPKWSSDAVELKNIADDYQKIISSVAKEKMDLDLLNVNFDSQDSSLVNQISQFVTALIDDYHYVVVDLPNEMDDVVLKTLTQSDVVQLVTLERREDLNMTRDIISKIKSELKEDFKKEKLHVVMRLDKEHRSMTFGKINKIIGYDVYAKLPVIDSIELDKILESDVMSITLPSEESDYKRIVKKTAREIGNVMVGLVLGGGAALGIAHIGVLKAIEKENIPVDIVVGSSMGALIGSLWVTGKSIEDLEKLAREFGKKQNLFRLLDLIIPISGLIGGRSITKWLKKHLGNKIFYDTEIPFKAIAYDLAKREEILIDSGSLVSAVRKSISIPGVMKPVVEKDKVIIDGGVLNPLPTNVMTRLGIKKVVAVNVLQSPDDVTKGLASQRGVDEEIKKVSFLKSPFSFISFRIKEILKRAFMPNISDIIINSLMASEYVISEQSAQSADIVIRPDLVGINWFELYKVNDLIRGGEEAAEKLMPQIKELIAE